MRILIAEDDPSLAEGLTQSLRNAGYAVNSVNSGEEANLALRRPRLDPTDQRLSR